MQLDPVETQFNGARPWRTLWHLFWPERRALAVALVSYLLKASPVWILPIITANIIDVLANHRDDGLHRLFINAGIGAFAIAQNIPSAAVYVAFLSRGIRNVEIHLRSALVRRLQMLSISFHNRVSTGAMQTKLTRDIESIEMLSRQLVDVGFFAVVTVTVTLSVIAWRMPVFLPVFILYVPLIWFVRHLISGRLRRHNEDLRRELEGMNSLVLGMINMIPITRAHAVEEEEIARLDHQFDNVRSAAKSFDFIAGTFGATAWVLLMLFNLAGLSVAAWLSYRGTLALTPGDIALLAGFFSMVMTAVLQLNAMLPVMTRGFDAIRSLGEILECPDVEENRGKRAVEIVRGNFQFENVTFAYDKTAEAPAALREISFSVAAGETVGIVGPSGSGKSTLVSLITGFHRPTSGKILLDGADMNSLDLRTYRRHLAIVSQQTILFNGTLRENIVYGLRGVTDAALREAVTAANAQEIISELPDGLETRLGAGGTQLSGGQRQRIAIARALLRNPRVLILDEATSSLDATGEAAVRQALERLAVGRTTFIIAHREAALRNVNRVLVLERGALK